MTVGQWFFFYSRIQSRRICFSLAFYGHLNKLGEADGITALDLQDDLSACQEPWRIAQLCFKLLSRGEGTRGCDGWLVLTSFSPFSQRYDANESGQSWARPWLPTPRRCAHLHLSLRFWVPAGSPGCSEGLMGCLRGGGCGLLIPSLHIFSVSESNWGAASQAKCTCLYSGTCVRACVLSLAFQQLAL